MTEEIQIKATALTPQEAADLFPVVLGKFFWYVEETVFRLAERHAPEQYIGGRWGIYKLDNGGLYMSAPKLSVDEAYQAVSPYNQSSATLTADAFGIAMCLMAYSHTSFHEHDVTHGEEDKIARAFHALRAYALQHEEHSAIFTLID